MKKSENKIDKQKLFIRIVSAVLAVILVGSTLAALIGNSF